jgi:putative SOS response-associated peptidase YedK
MKDGAPFGIAGIWENWKEPASGEWIRTFAIPSEQRNHDMLRARARARYGV